MNLAKHSLIVVTLCGATVTAHAGWIDFLNSLMMMSQPARPIEAPLLKPFADNQDWVLFRDLDYHVGESAIIISVPRGFVTDFASIPQAFWSFGLSPNGRYSKAAIVHDYLYWAQGCSRKQADNILLIAMKESDVQSSTRAEIYNGVRLGGEHAWQSNSIEKAKSLPRIVPYGFLSSGRMFCGETIVQRS